MAGKLRRIYLLLFTITIFVAAKANTARESKDNLFGVSGGNAHDISAKFCCSGTLGALVTKSGVDYILSNNHVLARTGLAKVGEAIIQPGLVDVGCIASLSR